MLMFLLGVYCCGFALTFAFVAFWCVLGGESEDLWRPPIYAALWPIALPLFLIGRI